jgi:hypothetical protein
MSLPLALNHINLWALDDGEGWTLVDTGMHTEETATAWQSVLSGPLADRPVQRVICTHMHPDHIGMAGWLTRRFRCQLWTSRLEYLTCRTLVADTGREAPADAIRFYRAAGWDSETIERYKIRFGSFGKMVYPLPDSYRRISDGDELLIGGRVWRVVVGRGHSPEQGHEQALLRLREALEARKTAADIFSLLFRRRVDGELLTMATGESVAHLNCLIRRGLAVREVDELGVAWYAHHVR